MSSIKASSCYTWVLTKILVFTCYHSDDDRVRLSVKDFWAISSLSGAFSYRKNQFWLSAHNYTWTRFSLWSSVLRDVATVKTLDIVWKHFWKKEGKRKNRRRGVLGKSQFCREKKNGKIKEGKKKQQKKARLVKYSSWIIKMCVNYFKTVFIDAYVPNIETTKSDNITESCSNQT